MLHTPQLLEALKEMNIMIILLALYTSYLSVKNIGQTEEVFLVDILETIPEGCVVMGSWVG